MPRTPRTREEIEEQIEKPIFVKDDVHPEGFKQSWTVIPVEVELMLDMRDILEDIRDAVMEGNKPIIMGTPDPTNSDK